MTPAVKKFLLDFCLIAVFGGIGGMLVFANPLQVYQRGGWELLWAYYWRSGLSMAVLWQGNAYLSILPDRYASWTEAPVRRLLLATGITVMYTCLAWILIVWLIQGTKYGWNLPALVRNLELRDFSIPLAITFFISIFMHGRGFLLGWKATLIEAERLKKEQIAARYEALKNQVNPHFLFNSLNVLASLVHQDADRAEQFIRRLSTVFRYILESRDREAVPLEEELDILRAYLFLMDTRFGASLQTEIQIPEPPRGLIAPLTLQMLVENALKHNEASKAKALRIEIFQEDNCLVVRNNLQPKSTALTESTGVGLANIQARYQMLSDREMTISDKDGFFTVTIPILNVPVASKTG